MKNIFTIISAFIFIAGSLFVNVFLSEGNTNVPAAIRQYAYEPVNRQVRSLNIQSVPFNKCNTEKQVEAAHVVESRFTTVRKILLRHPSFVPLSCLNKYSASILPVSNNAQQAFIDHTANNLPLHIRNCSWLI